MDASLYTTSDDRSSKRRSDDELVRAWQRRACSDTALHQCGRAAAQLAALQEEHKSCVVELAASRKEVQRLKAAFIDQEAHVERTREAAHETSSEKDAAYREAMDALQQQFSDTVTRERQRADLRIKENQAVTDEVMCVMKTKVLSLQREVAEGHTTERERSRKLNEELDTLQAENASLKQQLAGAEPTDTGDVSLLLTKLRLVGVVETAAAEKEVLLRQVSTLKGQVKKLSASLEAQSRRSSSTDASLSELLKQQELTEGKLHSERAFVATLLGSVDGLETL